MVGEEGYRPCAVDHGRTEADKIGGIRIYERFSRAFLRDSVNASFVRLTARRAAIRRKGHGSGVVDHREPELLMLWVSGVRDGSERTAPTRVNGVWIDSEHHDRSRVVHVEAVVDGTPGQAGCRNGCRRAPSYRENASARAFVECRGESHRSRVADYRHAEPGEGGVGGAHDRFDHSPRNGVESAPAPIPVGNEGDDARTAHGEVGEIRVPGAGGVRDGFRCAFRWSGRIGEAGGAGVDAATTVCSTSGEADGTGVVDERRRQHRELRAPSVRDGGCRAVAATASDVDTLDAVTFLQAQTAGGAEGDGSRAVEGDRVGLHLLRDEAVEPRVGAVGDVREGDGLGEAVSCGGECGNGGDYGRGDS